MKKGKILSIMLFVVMVSIVFMVAENANARWSRSTGVLDSVHYCEYSLGFSKYPIILLEEQNKEILCDWIQKENITSIEKLVDAIQMMDYNVTRNGPYPLERIKNILEGKLSASCYDRAVILDLAGEKFGCSGGIILFDNISSNIGHAAGWCDFNQNGELEFSSESIELLAIGAEFGSYTEEYYLSKDLTFDRVVHGGLPEVYKDKLCAPPLLVHLLSITGFIALGTLIYGVWGVIRMRLCVRASYNRILKFYRRGIIKPKRGLERS